MDWFRREVLHNAICLQIPLRHQSPLGPFALTLFSAGLKTFFAVWRTCLQHRVDQRQQFASQSNRCTFCALTLFYLPVPTREVQGSLSGDDPSHLAEHTLQIRIAFVNVSTLTFPALSLLPGLKPAQEHICWESGKALISVPISAIMAAAAVTSMPGMAAQQSQCLFVLCDFFRNSVLHRMAVLFK